VRVRVINARKQSPAIAGGRERDVVDDMGLRNFITNISGHPSSIGFQVRVKNFRTAGGGEPVKVARLFGVEVCLL